MSLKAALFFSILGSLLFRNTRSYNLDTVNLRLYRDPGKDVTDRKSYFGYSVALYADPRDLSSSKILVGAPRGNSSATGNILEPGTVYKCDPAGKCDEWVLDSSDNGFLPRNRNIRQIKDNAWIGATIGVENTTNPHIVVCGPRWRTINTIRNREVWYMPGVCYSKRITSDASFASEMDERSIIIPNLAPRNIDDQVYFSGMGETGFSLHVIPNQTQFSVMLGSPGIYYWSGDSYLYSQSKAIVPSVPRDIRAYEYFGYAVTSGNYFHKKQRWYVSGAPRSADMFGKVIIFTYPTQNMNPIRVKEILVGQQHGEYFGSVLASCDINSDGKDELLVGAPLYSKDFEEGRIDIYTSDSWNTLGRRSIEGDAPDGRFGSAISCLGDLDNDGFQDVAISAPYEDQRGCVYIFNGMKNGLSSYSQRICGSEISSEMRGFGISISQGMDIDGNKYPDVAIGAYASGHVALIRSKPVISLSMKFSLAEIKELKSNSTNFFLFACSLYDGPYAPDTLEIKLVISADEQFRRVTETDSTHFQTLQKGEISCKRLQFDLEKNMQNVMDSILILGNVFLNRSSKNDVKEGFVNDLTCTGCPIVNTKASKLTDEMEVTFAVDCGDDNICESDLDVNLSTGLTFDRYVIGSTSTVQLKIDVQNKGEPAYQTEALISMPESLSVSAMPRECSNNLLAAEGFSEIICQIGNPLRENKSLIIELDLSKVRYGLQEVKIIVNTTTHSEELNVRDNTKELTIHFDVDVGIAIAGKAQEDFHSYIPNEAEEKLKRITFRHMYEVQKFGTSPIEDAVLTVKIPKRLKNHSKDIVSLNKTIGFKDGQQFFCSDEKDTEGKSSLRKQQLVQEDEDAIEVFEYNHSNESDTFERFTIDRKQTLDLPPSNRTLFVNCSSTVVECMTLTCRLGSFESTVSVARLTLVLNLELANIEDTLLAEKDILFVITQGTTRIVSPDIEQNGNSSDSRMVGTTFVGPPIAQHVALWIIVLSVALGIILLLLTILALIKLGFFQRKKKEELRSLKADADKEDIFGVESTLPQESTRLK